MQFTPALLLALSATLAAAAPASISLGADDVILFGKGRFTMMKRSDVEELNSPVPPPMPGHLDNTMFTVSGNETRPAVDQLNKRSDQTIIIPGRSQRFLGWDTLMSPVIQGAPTTISVGSGYSISNSITVGVSTTFTIVEDFLQASEHIDYSYSWSSSQTQSFSAAVPAGKYGAFVSDAWTNRHSGNVWRGTIGGAGSLSHYQADSFESRGYGNLNWVDGVISLCLGDSFPLKRCHGKGTL